MAITVFASPQKLTWMDFTPVANQIRDPADGTRVDALTRFEYLLPFRPPRRVNGQFAFAESLTLLITPKCMVWTGVRQTEKLLLHEQFHYDVGILTARALARHLMALRAPSQVELGAQAQKAIRLHFVTRNHLIQACYDKDTKHGQNSHYQKIWKDRMQTCLAKSNPKTIGGFFL